MTSLALRTALLSACAALLSLAPASAEASSQQCIEGGTMLLHPQDGGSLAAGEGLVIAEQVCSAPAGFEAPEAPVFIAVSDLQVQVDGQPASLSPMIGAAPWQLWSIDPLPPEGAEVTITGCDQAARDANRCWVESPDEPPTGTALQWSFTVAEAEPAPQLVAPLLSEPGRMEVDDPFDDDPGTRWAVNVIRGEDDPGHPMLVVTSIDPGEHEVGLPWTTAAATEQEVSLWVAHSDDVCVQARTFDMLGNEGPSSSVCSESDSTDDSGCSCTTGGGSPAILGLVVMLFALRRRRS